MQAGTETQPSKPTVDQRWLRVVRIAAAASLLLILGPILVAGILNGVSGTELGLILPLLVPLCLPYPLIIWRLRAKTLKAGLALAVSQGLVISGLLLFILYLTEGDWKSVLFPFGPFLVVQAALVAGAIKAFYTTRREPGDTRRLVMRFSLVLLLSLILFAMWAPGNLRSRSAANESSAPGSLRNLNTALVQYDSTYGTFPTIIAQLGPSATASADAADLIDAVLAGGVKSGYTFSYEPGARDTKGRVVTYTITARPISYGQTGKSSFFTDESGLIRNTREDRPATVHDPPI